MHIGYKRDDKLCCCKDTMIYFWQYRRISHKKFVLGLLFTAFCLWYFLFSDKSLLSSEKDERKLIFIIAPGRSGSSLLGEMFNQLDEEFMYVFEPVKAVANYHRVHPAVHMDYDTFRMVTREQEEYLKDIVSCNYRQRNDKYIALNKQFVAKTKFMQKLCGRNSCKDKVITSQMMNQVCHENKNKHIVVKELYDRFPYEDSLSLDYLKQYSNGRKLYVVNSVRDPRAIFNSHKKLNWFYSNKYPKLGLREEYYVTTKCFILNSVLQRFANGKSLRTHAGLSSSSSTPHYSIRFEDISRSGKTLASFLGLNHLAETFEKYLQQKTKANEGAHKASLSLKARNINQVIDKWRKTISFSLVKLVQKHCHFMMETLGYRFVANEEDLHDLNKKLIIPLNQV